MTFTKIDALNWEKTLSGPTPVIPGDNNPVKSNTYFYDESIGIFVMESYMSQDAEAQGWDVMEVVIKQADVDFLLEDGETWVRQGQMYAWCFSHWFINSENSIETWTQSTTHESVRLADVFQGYPDTIAYFVPRTY